MMTFCHGYTPASAGDSVKIGKMNNNLNNTLFFLDYWLALSVSYGDMAKNTQDVLVQVVEDEEMNKLLVAGLRAELEKSPVKFYKDFVEPRSGKMREPIEGVVLLTVSQELASMQKATAPKEPNDKE